VKKLLFSLLAVVVCVGIAGSALAYFTDVETSTGNTFKAGTLDLKISDDNEYPPKDGGVSATWHMDNMVPGDSMTEPCSVELINTGSIAGDHVEISFSNEINDQPDVPSDTNPHSTPGEMARWLQILSMTYYHATFVNSHPTSGHAIVDANHNGFIDLEDVTLPENSDALDDLLAPPPNSGGTYSFTMNLLFNAGATNDIQGDTLTTTVTFTLNQVASQ
jgi:spore coat-associated protein N